MSSATFAFPLKQVSRYGHIYFPSDAVRLKDGRGLDINVTNNRQELLLRVTLDFRFGWLFVKESLVMPNRMLFLIKYA